MSVKLMSLVWDSAEQVSHAKLLVMLKLADSASDEGYCWPSQSTIARQCRLTRQTVNEVIQELESEGQLTIKRTGRASRYQLSFHDVGVPDISLNERCKPTGQQMSAYPTSDVGVGDTNHKRTINEPSDICQAFEFWKKTFSLNGNTTLTDSRKGVIAKALKTYGIERVKDAILGCSIRPFNNGQNDNGEKYIDIELILRVSKQANKLEFFERYWHEHRDAVTSRSAQKTLNQQLDDINLDIDRQLYGRR